MRDVTVQVRVTRTDVERWRRAAEADGRTLSDWIRNAIARNLREGSDRVP